MNHLVDDDSQLSLNLFGRTTVNGEEICLEIH